MLGISFPPPCPSNRPENLSPGWLWAIAVRPPRIRICGALQIQAQQLAGAKPPPWSLSPPQISSPPQPSPHIPGFSALCLDGSLTSPPPVVLGLLNFGWQSHILGGRAIAVRALLCAAAPRAGCQPGGQCRKGICILNPSWCSFTASEQLPQRIGLQHTYSRLRLGAAESRYLGRPSAVPRARVPPTHRGPCTWLQPLPRSHPSPHTLCGPCRSWGQAGTGAPPPCPSLATQPLTKAASHRSRVLGQALPPSWQPPGAKGRGTELQGTS